MASWAEAFGGPSTSQNYQTSFLDPELVRNLATQLGGTATQAGQQYFPTLQNVTQNPLFQGQLSGLLEALVPSEQKARTNLADAFRAAGNTGSSVFGNNAQNLESDILGNRRQAASQLLGQSFAQIMQALQQPMSQIPQLIAALRTAQGGSVGGRSGGQTFGGYVGGGGGGDFLNSPFSDPYAELGIQRPGPDYNMGGGYSGVNYNPANQAAWNAAIQRGNDLASLGSTMFMPGGQYVSGSPTSAGLYNPSGYSGGGANPWQSFEDTNWGYNNPSEDIWY